MAEARPLTEDEDAFGRQLLDHLEGKAGPGQLERDDGTAGTSLDVSYFFTGYDEWPEEEREVFGFARGRVLDIGCGAGRHSLAAQDRGFTAVGIDISPGAVEASSRRGVRDARLLPMSATGTSLGQFDTVLLMCGNFGLAGDRDACLRMLRYLHGATGDHGRIILDSVDPYHGADPADLAYMERNAARGRMPGQVTIRIRYGRHLTPWFDLLLVSPAELGQLATETDWRVARLVPGEPPDFYAVLEKAGGCR